MFPSLAHNIGGRAFIHKHSKFRRRDRGRILAGLHGPDVLERTRRMKQGQVGLDISNMSASLCIRSDVQTDENPVDSIMFTPEDGLPLPVSTGIPTDLPTDNSYVMLENGLYAITCRVKITD
jgi:hypothetical protein